MDKHLHAHSLPHGKEKKQEDLPVGNLPKGKHAQEFLMQQKFENRRQRLIELMNQRYERRRGYKAEAARLIGCSDNYLSRLLTEQPKNRKNIGEDFREKIERAFGLEHGWLDKPSSVTIYKDTSHDKRLNPVLAREPDKQYMTLRMEMILELESMLRTINEEDLAVLHRLALSMVPKQTSQAKAG